MADLAYLARMHREPTPLLLELEQQGRYDDVPVVDRAVGRLLSSLVTAMQANRILEFGTGYGLATLWMAQAMPPAGHIWTVDPDIERTTVALDYFARAGKRDAIEVINQPARDIITNFPQRNVDIVFVDARVLLDGDVIDDCIPFLKRSGLLIVDKMLKGTAGEEPTNDDDDETEALREFNRHFLTHPQLDATILPIGTGIGIGARLE
jgi:predicted O-methyltransferase YrrM